MSLPGKHIEDSKEIGVSYFISRSSECVPDFYYCELKKHRDCPGCKFCADEVEDGQPVSKSVPCDDDEDQGETEDSGLSKEEEAEWKRALSKRRK